MLNTADIVQLGDPILREPAQRIDDPNNPKFHALMSTLQTMMQEANGVGIAAPQIGESWQLIIIASRPTARYPNAPLMQPIIMINPSFEVTDSTTDKDWEGCLSVPGIRALVPRVRAIKVYFQNPQGESQELELKDFPARVFQHEFDHLQGLVYLDRVENNHDIVAESEFFKLITT